MSNLQKIIRKKWTNDDIGYLISSYINNIETSIISQKLERSENAIKLKLENIIKEINPNFIYEYNEFIKDQIFRFNTDLTYKYHIQLEDTTNKEIKEVLNHMIDIIDDSYGLTTNQLKGYNLIKEGHNIFLTGEAGCHSYDSEILMYDGSIKKVQDIKNTDIIMGDDSTPRNIIKLIKGFDQMYTVTHTEINDSYTVNRDHILK